MSQVIFFQNNNDNHYYLRPLRIHEKDILTLILAQ